MEFLVFVYFLFDWTYYHIFNNLSSKKDRIQTGYEKISQK